MDSNLPSEHRNHEGTFSATLGIIVPNAFAFFTPFELLKTRILIAPLIAIEGRAFTRRLLADFLKFYRGNIATILLIKLKKLN